MAIANVSVNPESLRAITFSNQLLIRSRTLGLLGPRRGSLGAGPTDYCTIIATLNNNMERPADISDFLLAETVWCDVVVVNEDSV
jgi:hypothetical protein